MNKLLLSGGLVALLALGVVTGCGDDDEGGGAGGTAGTGGGTGGTGGGTGGTGGGTGGTGGTAGGATGGSGGMATGGSGGMTGLGCDAYCTAIMSACSGADAQYPNMESCKASCATIPAGTAADMSGNTLGCRVYHTGNVATMGVSHCPHAGPAGTGICGSNCEGYCNLMLGVCPSEYADRNECETACANFPGASDMMFSTASTTGDTVQCRIYHATNAADPGQAGTDHCGHAAEMPTSICQ